MLAFCASHGDGRVPPDAVVGSILCLPMLSEEQKSTLLAVRCAVTPSILLREKSSRGRQGGGVTLCSRKLRECWKWRFVVGSCHPLCCGLVRAADNQSLDESP